MACGKCNNGSSSTGEDVVTEINGNSQNPAYPATSCGTGCTDPGLFSACCDEPNLQPQVYMPEQGKCCPPTIVAHPQGIRPVGGWVAASSDYDSCGCGCGSKGGQCCGNTQYANPTPYYSNVPVYGQDHTRTIIEQELAAGLSVQNSWNIPACNGSSVLQIPGLTNAVNGSYLWNPSYGYFKVISFNNSNSTVVIQNDCHITNQAVGTQIPACTTFIVVDTPATTAVAGTGGVGSAAPYLAVDFTAPAIGSCVTITVTTSAGFAVGKNIQINASTYRVSSIVSGTLMSICNDGIGAVPGSSVFAKDSSNVLQYPIAIIDTNACTNTAVTSGAILVCKNSVTQPLSGATLGMVPVLTDVVNNTVEYKILNVPTRTCTALTSCLNLVPGQASYVLVVGDSGQFHVADIVQLGNTTDRLTITAINDATHITVNYSPVPTLFSTVAIATSICIADCCESAITGFSIAAGTDPCSSVSPNHALKSVAIAQTGKNVALTFSSAREHDSLSTSAAGGIVLPASVNLDAVGVYTNPAATGTIGLTNTNPCRPLAVMIAVSTQHRIQLAPGGAITIRPQLSVNGGAFTDLVNVDMDTIGQDPTAFNYQEDFRHHQFLNFTIPPSGSLTLVVNGRVDTTNNFLPGARWRTFFVEFNVIGSTQA